MSASVAIAPLRAPRSCASCSEGTAAPFPFSVAFQPIVDLRQGTVFAYEALVRGPAGEPASSILSQVDDGNRYAFDQSSRRLAIELSCRLGLIDRGARLSINFMPGAMYDPQHCIRTSIAAANRSGLAPDRLIFEVIEYEYVPDRKKLSEIFRVYRSHGIANALDDFGAGHANLLLFAELEPEILKLDMDLTRGIERSASKRVILAGLVGICRTLGIRLVAEGIETEAELDTIRSVGIELAQGYRLGRPLFEALGTPVL